MAAFRGSEQPVEGHNDEVNDVSIESSADGMLCVDDVTEGADDSQVDWVGA